MEEPLSNLTKGNRLTNSDSAITVEKIYASTLIRLADNSDRLADATEKMATNYVQLQKDLDYYKNAYREKVKEVEAQQRTIAALKGHLTRKKNSSSN